MKLYLDPRSPNCFKVLPTAELLTLTELAPVVRPFQWENLIKPRITGAAPDSAVLKAAAAPFRSALRILDASLLARKHVANNELMFTDVTGASSLMHAGDARMPLESCTAVCRWLDSLTALPAWSAANAPIGAA